MGHLERDSWLSGTFFPSLVIDKSVAFFIIWFLYPCRIPFWLGVTLHLVQAIGCTACSSAGSGHSLWSLSGARWHLSDKQEETGLAPNGSPKPGRLCLQRQAFSVCPHSCHDFLCLCRLLIWVLICLLWSPPPTTKPLGNWTWLSFYFKKSENSLFSQ